MLLKKILLVIFFTSLFVPHLFSQDLRKAFDSFIGTWDGNYEINEYKNIETMSNSWILGGKYFRIEIAGELADNPSARYFSLSLFTLDKDDNIIGWFFNENGYRGQFTWKGKVINNMVEISGKNSSGSTKMTFEMKDGKLINKREYNFGSIIKTEVIFSKR